MKGFTQFMCILIHHSISRRMKVLCFVIGEFLARSFTRGVLGECILDVLDLSRRYVLLFSLQRSPAVMINLRAMDLLKTVFTFKVYFDSDEVHACIVTCGGLCPGLNTVIREIVCALYNMYGKLLQLVEEEFQKGITG